MRLYRPDFDPTRYRYFCLLVQEQKQKLVMELNKDSPVSICSYDMELSSALEVDICGRVLKILRSPMKVVRRIQPIQQHPKTTTNII